jgi:hypothetical protein
MNVTELIAQLNTYNPDTEIIISRDSEGNGFSPVDEVAFGLYAAKGGGEVYRLDEEGIAGRSAIKAVILYPA